MCAASFFWHEKASVTNGAKGRGQRPPHRGLATSPGAGAPAAERDGQRHQQIGLGLDWANAVYMNDQSRLDLFQLTMLSPFRGGVGKPWETILPPSMSS